MREALDQLNVWTLLAILASLPPRILQSLPGALQGNHPAHHNGEGGSHKRDSQEILLYSTAGFTTMSDTTTKEHQTAGFTNPIVISPDTLSHSSFLPLEGERVHRSNVGSALLQSQKSHMGGIPISTLSEFLYYISNLLGSSAL